jgi:hypothetical protein
MLGGDVLPPLLHTVPGCLLHKVYKYKVVSTRFNDDIYGIEIIYLEERLHVLMNILAMRAARSDGADTS